MSELDIKFLKQHHELVYHNLLGSQLAKDWELIKTFAKDSLGCIYMKWDTAMTWYLVIMVYEGVIE